MNSSIVVKALRGIQDTCGKGNSRILDDINMWVLDEAIKAVEYTSRKFERDPDSNPDWGYEIPQKSPLRFKQSKLLNGVTVDVYCRLRWSDGAGAPSKQEIKMLIWSEKERVIFRRDLDSTCVEKKLTDPNRKQRGRVISRFHFDRAEVSPNGSGEYHPKFHMQIGSNSDRDELYWHPKGFDLPRIPYHPMDLLLTCQLVAINFFPEEYERFRTENHWVGPLREIQQRILKEHYEECAQAIREDSSLLDLLRAKHLS